MKMILSENELVKLVIKQLDNIFVFNAKTESDAIEEGVSIALKRSEYCFSFNTTRYYSQDSKVFFSPFQSSQYTTFLYYLSNTLWEKLEEQSLADRVYYLNKALNGVDLFYESKLPDIFNVDHPLGTIMGRANYSNYLCITQYCTVGNNNGIYPTFGENVVLYPGSTVIGDVRIGNNCAIASGAWIKDESVPDNSLVFGRSPNLVIKEKPASYFWEVPGKWKIPADL